MDLDLGEDLEDLVKNHHVALRNVVVKNVIKNVIKKKRKMKHLQNNLNLNLKLNLKLNLNKYYIIL